MSPDTYGTQNYHQRSINDLECLNKQFLPKYYITPRYDVIEKGNAYLNNTDLD